MNSGWALPLFLSLVVGVVILGGALAVRWGLRGGNRRPGYVEKNPEPGPRLPIERYGPDAWRERCERSQSRSRARRGF